MCTPYFGAENLDDVMLSVINEILASGEQIYPTKGGPKGAKELSGVLLEISNPRARLSRTETKGKPFSCLGELCWYLSKSNDLDFIKYYLQDYNKYADGDKIYGGYGPRLFNWNGINQVSNIIDILKKKPNSRQAVIQLFDGRDIVEDHKDIPCTCTLQFMIRSGKLQMFTNMRSNDVMVGLPHDIFCFTMLQEIIAVDIGVALGTYKHAVGSLHIYEKSRRNAESYVSEGWQSTGSPMPPMPTGSPWPSIESLLQAEEGLRNVGTYDESILQSIDAYWADLIRLLHAFRCKKDKSAAILTKISSAMDSEIYDPFMNKLSNELLLHNR